MAWRGLNQELLALLDSPFDINANPDVRIDKLALQAAALTHLDQLTRAKEKFDEADLICSGRLYDPCYHLMLTHGVNALERGQQEEAKRYFMRCLDSGPSNKFLLLRATALLNLSAVSLQQERYDEALHWAGAAFSAASSLGGEDLAQSALGNQGRAYYGLGDFEKALELFLDAQKRAEHLGDIGISILWLTSAGNVYASTGQTANAAESYKQALRLSEEVGRKEDIVNASMDLAELYSQDGHLQEADKYANQAWSMAQQSGNHVDMLYSHLILGQTAALRHDWSRAETLLNEVETAPDSQTSMKWAAEHALAKLYEAQGQSDSAQKAYLSALTTFEGARAELRQDDSRLSFVSNATQIYDDYIHFLIEQKKPVAALEAADWSRGRTLEQGLGLIKETKSVQPLPFSPQQIARSANAILLFYWLGEKQSYLWAISPGKTDVATLPSKQEISARINRYNKTLLNLEDPARDSNAEGLALYNILVAPASSVLSSERPVIIVADGELSQLNFETLLVPSPRTHYWLEDATILSAPSIRMLTSAKTVSATNGKLLLIGDPIPPGTEYLDLPMAHSEMLQVQKHFHFPSAVVFSQNQATPSAYLSSKPQQYSYIHFVAHGTASRMSPLDSAVILSKDGQSQDNFKLYARDILRYPINARLVTMSACYSSGTRSYAGEGLVGLSWAFLRAGAHNTIGSLWDASDESSPRLMDDLYAGLEKGNTPADSLRNAKLNLLRSRGRFSRPFYWAPFQLYAGR